jgi:hypothetical protein
MANSTELRLKVKGLSQNMISEMARCFKTAEPFYFFGYQYTVVFYEISRDMNNEIKAAEILLSKLP